MISYQTTDREYVMFYEEATRVLMDRRFSPKMVDAFYQNTKVFNDKLKKPIDLSNLERLVNNYHENEK